MAQVGTIARIVFLARVPIFLWLILLIFSLVGPHTAYTVGLFDIEQPFGLLWVSLSVSLVGAGIAVAVNLIIEHGIVRSQTGTLALPRFSRYTPSRWLFWAAQAPGILLVYFAYQASERDGVFKLYEILI